jgi:hypothetical protein
MAGKKSDLSLSIPKENVMYTSISKDKQGYNSARMMVKMGDKEYMSISYEWEGDGVPTFAMDLMGFMKANSIKSGEVVAGMEVAYEEYSKKGCDTGVDKKMKKNAEKKSETKDEKCPDCGKPVDECTCDDEK